jgi:transposase
VTVFTKNRERLLDGDIAEAFFQAVLRQARQRNLLSDEHFTVDGNAAGSLGELEKFSAKGWQAFGSAGRSWQCDSRLSR